MERERDRALVFLKREVARGADGHLRCEACGFATQDVFAGLAGEVCEVHHRLPLADATGTVVTHLEDLAVLCANCHRAIHKTDPLMTVPAFKARFIGHQTTGGEDPQSAAEE
jgi:5-methylcytosine-specific restriction protein A